CHDRPDDPGGFVRHRDSRDPHGLSRQQIDQTWIDRLLRVIRYDNELTDFRTALKADVPSAAIS
ncbi:MAG: hypothetical protein ACRECG_08015, partial [Bradyrhizobium sp.]